MEINTFFNLCEKYINIDNNVVLYSDFIKYILETNKEDLIEIQNNYYNKLSITNNFIKFRKNTQIIIQI